MFNKFEIFGITASIVAMIVGLYLVTSYSPGVRNIEQAAAVAGADNRVVVDPTVNNQNEALRTAITKAAGSNGALEKLVVHDVKFGIGEEVVSGDVVTVHYVGTLQNGFEFDNSRKRGSPFTFTVGAGDVIAGWEEGVLGMRVGGARILVIPPALGYGASGFGPIPPNSPLVFSIELIEIK
jgi:FKBP-type peptidyl-prolyl cis-trans isomerase